MKFSILIAGLVVLMMGCQSATQTVMVDDTVENNEEMITFEMTGVDFAFFMDGVERPELRVKQGQRVRIEFTSTDGFHDVVIDEFNAATQQVNTGKSTFVEFTASQKGTFEYYCSVGKHRAQGMWGNIVVE